MIIVGAFVCIQFFICFIAIMLAVGLIFIDEFCLLDNIFESIFIWQFELKNNLEDSINNIGICILITILTLIIWPCSIIMFFLVVVAWLLKILKNGFLYFFGKPDYDLYCCGNCNNFKWNLNKKCVCEPECKNAEIKYMEYSKNGLYVDLVKYCQNFEEKQS